jgi:hypothetical protein
MAAAIDPLARQRKLRLALYGLMVVGAVLVLSSCAPGSDPAQTPGEAGFWLGLWHGIIFPIAFFISLFSHKVGVYEVSNNGNWYDFGFFLGIVVIGGGGGVGARRAKRRRN